MRTLADLPALADAAGITIEKEGDTGYWACFFDIPCPPGVSAAFIEAWNECDDELRFERGLKEIP